MKFFDDIQIGERYALGAYHFTAESITSFATRFDPQLFHVDEEAARESSFGGLCASGWHTAVTWMRLMIEFSRRDDEERRARGEKMSQMGPSPGLQDLKWLKPVYAGDTITYASEVTAIRVSKSRPEFGLITMVNTGVNQNGETVISFVSTAFAKR